MQIITTNAEQRLVEEVKALRADTQTHFAIHFHLSGLQEHYRSDFQLRIAVNILNDIFRSDPGHIIAIRGGDIFVLYAGKDRKLLEKAIFQLRYLFVDDQLANHDDGTPNSEFSTVYDLTFQWRVFYRICSEILEATQHPVEEELMAQEHEAAMQAAITAPPLSAILEAQAEEKVQPELFPTAQAHGESPVFPSSSPLALKHYTSFNPAALTQIIEALPYIDIGFALRRQPICAIKRGQKIRTVYYEVYVNMAHLKRLLAVEFNLASDRWLFRYLTGVLDNHVLALLLRKPKQLAAEAIALNLNVATILSPTFNSFCDRIKEATGVPLVVEIGVADVFADMDAFLRALAFCKQKGVRTCLDGLSNESFIQFDRELMGVDLIKLQWNADMRGDLVTEQNQKLKAAIERSNANRLILCRCDSSHAIEYGHALGITLFQGRYADKILDPDSVVIN